MSGPDAVANVVQSVSRETLTRLEAYAALLLRWSAAVNLVSRNTLTDVWHRHIADSAQLWSLSPISEGRWLDLGSGAGFPGLVVAILAQGAGSGAVVTLVESDQRKAAFLRAAATETATPVTICAERVEALVPQAADVVSARALAALPQLLEWTYRHRKSGGTALFPKGRKVHNEIDAARNAWLFNLTEHQSLTDPEGSILEIGALQRA